MTGQIEILESQCEWTAAAMADESLWTEVFSDEERKELDAATRHALRKSRDVLDIERDDFPLPRLGRRLKQIESELIDGRGFVRLRGIERERYDRAELEMLYWGIGMHLGSPWPQNHYGHVLGDVTDQGKSANDPTARGNELGGMALPFHCDGSDLVGLLCLQEGAGGGRSAVANAVSIHNQLVREAPECAAELYRAQPNDFRGEQAPGKPGWYSVPVFTAWEGRLFVRCIPPFILASQRHADCPRLTPLAREGLSRLVELADDPTYHITMELLPGDIQFINNYHLMHGRTAYRDDRANGRVRHLKRLWLETDILASRPAHFRNNTGSHWGRKRTASRLTVG